MNNAGIQGRLAAKEGRVVRLLDAKTPDAKIAEEFYLAAFARFPTPPESKQAAALLAKSKDRQRAAEDLLWALLNSKEFLFNH